MRKKTWWGSPTVEVDGQTVNIETMPVLITGIEVGQRYVAERNCGRKLLTCEAVSDGGWLVAEGPAYSYDLHECFRVIENGQV